MASESKNLYRVVRFLNVAFFFIFIVEQIDISFVVSNEAKISKFCS